MIYLKPLIGKLITDKARAAEISRMSSDEEILNALMREVSIGEIERVFARHYGTQYRRLNFNSVDVSLLDEFDIDFLKRESVVPYSFNPNKNEWSFAISDLIDKNIRDVVSDSVKANNQRAKFTFAFKHEIEQFYNDMSENKTEFASIEVSPSDTRAWVEAVINKGIEMRASDIHIEREKEGLRIRYRVDGTMTEKQVFSMTDDEISNIYVRLKIISDMDISEKRRSQDGRIDGYEHGGSLYSLRSSTINTIHGEKIAMRLFSESKEIERFEELGFTSEHEKILKRMINKTNGIIYLAGATGSGKTTTLYTMINELDSDDLNIYTIENPSEKTIEGVNQVQIDEASGNTYPSVLKTLLRQDPDIMVVGEIREAETSRLAVQASLTGHLVMTTIHANNAVDSINRLIDMGVESYLIGASSVGFISQRLVRVLCEECKVKVDQLPEHEKMWIESEIEDFNYDSMKSKGEYLYKANGCEKCVNGYKGRKAVVEIIEVDDGLRTLISRKASSKELRDYLENSGYKKMKYDGIMKTFKGITSIEELMGKLQD